MSVEIRREPLWKIVLYWLLALALLMMLVRTPHLLAAWKATNDRAWMELIGFWLCIAVAIETTRRRLRYQAATGRA
jgi:hypothetical protein